MGHHWPQTPLTDQELGHTLSTCLSAPSSIHRNTTHNPSENVGVGPQLPGPRSVLHNKHLFLPPPLSEAGFSVHQASGPGLGVREQLPHKSLRAVLQHHGVDFPKFHLSNLQGALGSKGTEAWGTRDNKHTSQGENDPGCGQGAPLPGTVMTVTAMTSTH